MNELNTAEKMVLVFDWGNTLMQVLPQYSGPMADWPEVQAVAGVPAALEHFQGRWPMVVATNAADSSAPQVQQALERAGLGHYFKAVFTSLELGSRKPDGLFYRQMESVLARGPHEMVMVGDSYTVDMLGAKMAGWLAVWYNPNNESAPGSLPLHDLEIQNMTELPAALEGRRLPDYATCLAWLNSRGTPLNLLAHIELVAAAAYSLAVWLRQKHIPVDPILTHRGAMLHDLAKIDAIRLANNGVKEDEDHAAAAAALLGSFGQPELAEIASRHMPYADANDPRRPITWEEKLVHYADKLAEGAKLVSIDERFHALKGRYPQFATQMEASRPNLTVIEQEICEQLGLTPDALLNRLRQVLGQ